MNEAKCVFETENRKGVLTCSALRKHYCSGGDCSFYKGRDEWKIVRWKDENGENCMEVVRK